MPFFVVPFPWNLLVFLVAALGWLFGRWRGRRVSLSGLAICVGAVLFGPIISHAADVDGTPLLILLPLAMGFAGAAALKNWVGSAALTAALALLAVSFGEIVLLAVGCSFDSAACL